MSSFFDIAIEPQVVVRARNGDRAAAEAVYGAFEQPVWTLVRRLVPSRAAAEDLAQDVFVEILTSLPQFDGRGSFAGWVRAITVNKCLMHLRSPWQRSLRWLESTAAEGSTGECEELWTKGPGDQVDLERALARLGYTARLVVWLHDVEGYTHAEIGALLGGTASLSKSQLARAHERLRSLLEADGKVSACMQASASC